MTSTKQPIQEETQLFGEDVRQLVTLLKQHPLPPKDAVVLMEKVPLLSGNKSLSHMIITQAGAIVRDMIANNPDAPESAKNKEIMKRAGQYLCTLNFSGISKEQWEQEFANLDPFMTDDPKFQALKNKQRYRNKTMKPPRLLQPEVVYTPIFSKEHLPHDDNAR